MHALIATNRLAGVSPAEHAELCEQLAPSIAAVPGLVSKTWLSEQRGLTSLEASDYSISDGPTAAFVTL